ncbi:unnamed protein product [Tetraodon nigroviridis]|uniref:(spotted green pufferfish) hypothetical protein n=1 Tax=Tetraodon nigroviridis TaxID=99883 RepID=Q4RYW6_TETNG|nr:unnamed protein product [Tetraodon nigroviridis]
MPADYNGRWEMVSNENFEEVMKALDAGYLGRRQAGVCSEGGEAQPRLETLDRRRPAPPGNHCAGQSLQASI